MSDDIWTGVVTVDGPVAVRGVPGSGLTTLAVQRVAHLAATTPDRPALLLTPRRNLAANARAHFAARGLQNANACTPHQRAVAGRQIPVVPWDRIVVDDVHELQNVMRSGWMDLGGAFGYSVPPGRLHHVATVNLRSDPRLVVRMNDLLRHGTGRNWRHMDAGRERPAGDDWPEAQVFAYPSEIEEVLTVCESASTLAKDCTVAVVAPDPGRVLGLRRMMEANNVPYWTPDAQRQIWSSKEAGPVVEEMRANPDEPVVDLVRRVATVAPEHVLTALGVWYAAEQCTGATCSTFLSERAGFADDDLPAGTLCIAQPEGLRGLEFDVVICTSMVESLWPSRDVPIDMARERLLLAMSRATRTVLFSVPMLAASDLQDKVVRTRPSRFLAEMGLS